MAAGNREERAGVDATARAGDLQHSRKKRKKRGSSGLSFVCGVNKPCGLTSHDVVNRTRRIFGERRVGHAGTLDPAASGVMLVCVGPATRLSNFFVGHDKKYIARINFGSSTDTDDAQGQITRTAKVPACVLDENFAREYLAGILGAQKQLPPVYSALKVGGKKACDEARRGRVIDLKARDIEVFGAKLLEIGEGAQVRAQESAQENDQENALENAQVRAQENTQVPFWLVEFHVSSGTYIRALARDIGLGVGSVAHLGALERISLGRLSLRDCATLDALEREGVSACIDPVNLLGYRVAFLHGDQAKAVQNGVFLPADTQLFHARFGSLTQSACVCTSGVVLSEKPPQEGEKISVVAENKLCAIYSYSGRAQKFKPECVFSVGVSRGACL